MSEEVAIKVIKTTKIPTDKIKMGSIQARQSQVTKGLDRFAEQIRKIGLIQPIVVYPDGDGYELVVGQRRYLAHKILKLNEIFAMIIDTPKDSIRATTISWLENEARQKMQNKDKIRHVVNMYSQKYSQKEIARELGILLKEVKACIGLPRTPDVVREAVERGEIPIVLAIRATDAKGFDKGTTSEDEGNDVLDLARQIHKNKLTEKQINNMQEYGETNPDATNNELMVDGIVNTSEQLTIDLQSSDMERLDKYAKNNDQSRSSAAANLILDGLKEYGD